MESEVTLPDLVDELFDYCRTTEECVECLRHALPDSDAATRFAAYLKAAVSLDEPDCEQIENAKIYLDVAEQLKALEK
jgi:hypothetical protein